MAVARKRENFRSNFSNGVKPHTHTERLSHTRTHTMHMKLERAPRTLTEKERESGSQVQCNAILADCSDCDASAR